MGEKRLPGGWKISLKRGGGGGTGEKGGRGHRRKGGGGAFKKGGGGGGDTHPTGTMSMFFYNALKLFEVFLLSIIVSQIR